jgi:hypothetical protein
MSDINKKLDFINNIEIKFDELKKLIFNKGDKSLRVFYINKLMPFFRFLNNFPESLIAIFSELDELHEMELYERLFLIRQAEKLVIRTSHDETKPIFSLKNKLIIIKNKIIINFNKKILNIFFKISVSGERS